eukprot:gene8729-13517_t
MIEAGQPLPDHEFSVLGDSGMQPTTTDDIFKGKKVVLFAVPGAFTPTCSEKHLPGFIENADKLKEKGVDKVVCLAVNDAFVMSAWGKHQKAGDILMLADGDASFTKKLGLVKETAAFGGTRSERYAMIVEDKIVKKIFVDKKAFEVSSAEHVLGQL